MKHFFLATQFLTILLSFGAMAQSLDSGDNKDRIQQDHFLRKARESFGTLDTNRSGKLEKNECAGHTHWCIGADANQDKVIEEIEHVNHAQKEFKLRDKNNDGFLDRKEGDGLTLLRW